MALGLGGSLSRQLFLFHGLDAGLSQFTTMLADFVGLVRVCCFGLPCTRLGSYLLLLLFLFITDFGCKLLCCRNLCLCIVPVAQESVGPFSSGPGFLCYFLFFLDLLWGLLSWNIFVLTFNTLYELHKFRGVQLALHLAVHTYGDERRRSHHLVEACKVTASVEGDLEVEAGLHVASSN